MSKERADLTNEALKINGSYIEDAVPGFTVLKTDGRETLEKEFDSFEYPGDGGRIKSARYPVREIKVEYILAADSRDEMISRFRSLMKILDAEDAQIIFNDEPDKYMTGSFKAESDLEKYQKVRQGSFTIVCSDPFKYAVTPVTQSFSSNQVSINYDGTYKAYPVLTASFPATRDSSGKNTDTSEYGYFGFANSMGAMLQFGNPEETDYEELTDKTFALINNTFKSFGDWQHDNASTTLSSNFLQTGTAAVNASAECVYADDYGSGSKWHGPSVYMDIPTETYGTAGAANFKLTVKHAFSGSAKKQYGCFQILLLDTSASPVTIAGGVSIEKTSNDNNCKVNFYSSNASKAFKSQSVKCANIGTTVISKEGARITITCGGKTFNNTPSGFASKKAYQVMMFFGRTSSKTVLTNNKVTSVLFEKDNCTWHKDIKNTFQPGMTVTADCSDGSILLGDENAQSLGALGNDWEDFALTPGSNVITVDYTGWKNETETPTAPVFTIRYRKRYL